MRDSLLVLAMLTLGCLPHSSLAGAPTGIRLHASATAPSWQWTWDSPAPDGDHFNVVAYGGGVSVAAGQDGAIYSSTDGVHWSPQSAVIGIGGNYFDGIYAGGKFVLAGVDAGGLAHLTSSTDGVHWIDTQLSQPAFQPTAYPAPAQPSLTWGNGTYLLMGLGGTLASSADGVNWTVRPTGFNSIGSVAYANGVFIASGNVPASQGYVATFVSTDGGLTWTYTSYRFSGNVVSNSQTFFSFAYSGVDTSTDGVHWTTSSYTGSSPFGDSDALVVWDGKQFVAMGATYSTALSYYVGSYTSPDGITWTEGNPVSGGSMTFDSWDPAFGFQHVIAATGNGYLAVGLTGDARFGALPLNVLQSGDFSAWTPAFTGTALAIPSSIGGIADMIHAGGRYVAVGSSSTGPVIMESADGKSWQVAYSDPSGHSLTTVAYGNGVYVAAGRGAWLTSSDGINWQAITNPPPPIISQLAFGNGLFMGFAGDLSTCNPFLGCNNQVSVTSTDGQTWTSHALPAAFAGALAVYNIGYIGTSFISLGIGSPGTSLEVFKTGDGVSWTNSATGIAFPAGNTTYFFRLRLSSKGLAAVGYSIVPGGRSFPSITDPVIATSPDGLSWSANVLSGQSFNFTDVAFEDGYYYAADGLHVAVSADTLHWSDLEGMPAVNGLDAVMADGSQIMAAGTNGEIITGTPAPPLPPQGSGSGGGSSGGGDLDMLTLMGLFTLAALRRRR